MVLRAWVVKKNSRTEEPLIEDLDFDGLREENQGELQSTAFQPFSDLEIENWYGP